MINRLPRAVKAPLRAIRNAAASGAALPLSVALNVMPRLVRVRINARTRLTGTMDYRPSPIRMHVDSLTELGRLRSCIKEPGTVAWLEEFMGSDDVLYDIGANVGAYSLIAASKVMNGNGKVVSFEPSYRNFSRLNENLELNGVSEKVIPISVALSNSVDIARFRFSSVEIGAALHNMEGATLRRNARPSVAVSNVLTMPLDQLVPMFDLPMPTMIKLDVDGPELEILQGAATILEHPGLRTIQIEVEPDQAARARITDLLESKGWTLRSRNTHYGDAVDEDWVWVRQ